MAYYREKFDEHECRWCANRDGKKEPLLGNNRSYQQVQHVYAGECRKNLKGR